MSDKPNILLILTDQQRWDSLGCYGANWVDTPNLDRLGREGAIFDNCYVNNPVCTPSRSSLWTGKELPGHGVYKLYDNLPHDEVLFPERLRRAGYYTALYGKLHTSGRLFEAYHRHPNDGFDEYEWGLEASIHLDSPFNGYSRWLQAEHPAFYSELEAKGRALLHHPQEVHFTHWAAERSIDFIRRRSREGPFFCCMSVFDPHNPYEDYPLSMLDHVHQDRLPERVADPRRDRPRATERERAHSYLGSFEDMSDEDIHSMRLGYYASIALIDIEVGRVLDTLEEQGVSEDTLVIFASDHGDMTGDHDLVVKGAYFYDACTKVPFLLRWPARLAGGTRVDALVQPHDVARTVLEAAGAADEKAKDSMPTSADLLPLARGEIEAVHEYVVCPYRNSGISDDKQPWDPPIYGTMVHDGRYKLSVYHDESGRPVDGGSGRLGASRRPASEPEGELYDMKADPAEMNDLFRREEAADARQRLTNMLVDWLFRHERAGLGTRGGEQIPGAADRLDNRLKST